MPNEPANPVFLLDCIAGAFHFAQRVLQIRLLVDIVPLLVNQLEGEVAKHPQERRKVGSHLVRVNLLTLLHLELFGEVDDER